MKQILLFLICGILLFSVAGCGKDEPGILFNKNPITKENVLDNSLNFERGNRIYYLILMPKKVRSRFLFVQLMKVGSADRLGYKLYWGKDIRLKDEEINYYTDYFVLNEKGTYVMKVYSKDNPTKELTSARFFVY